MKSTTILIAALAALANAAAVQKPVEKAVLGSQTSQGCFKGKGDWDFYAAEPMSLGTCKDICMGANKDYNIKAGNYTVTALFTEGCYCGNNYPAKSDLVDDSNCSYVCPAWDEETCGGFTSDGDIFYSVYNLGYKIAVPNKSSDTTSSSTSSTSAPTNTAATSAGQSNTAAASNVPNDSDNNDDSGPSVGGIVGGVVAGIAVVGIIGGIVFFVWRRRRNQAIEDEHRRNATVNSFISGAKPPSSSGVSMTDSRMDPGMAHQRRLSDGSIADNQDYSRKILRVTNA